MAQVPEKPPGYWNIWWTLSAVFLALGLLFATLELLGVFGEIGVLLTVVSFGIALYFGLTGATRASLRTVEYTVRSGFSAHGERFDAMTARLDRITAGLDRIATLLEERLPHQSS